MHNPTDTDVTDDTDLITAIIEGGDAPLISIRGYTLTINEAHAIVLGLAALPIGEGGVAYHTVQREPHYLVGTGVLAYIAGRVLRYYSNRDQ